jgi:hypothetical protein
MRTEGSSHPKPWVKVVAVFFVGAFTHTSGWIAMGIAALYWRIRRRLGYP